MFTSEIKFVLDESTATALRRLARTEMTPDPHAVELGGDGYQTTTLYFDTNGFDLYFRRGSTARAKFRIRRYNEGQGVFLERKMKVGASRLNKRRSHARVVDLERLAELGSDWSGDWFARRLQHRRLRPVCQVAYRRTARVGSSATGSVRLTIDQDITAGIVETIAFTNRPGAEILPGRAILELKYCAPLPLLFKRIIEEFHLEPQPTSKYRLAIQTLGIAGDTDAMLVAQPMASTF